MDFNIRPTLPTPSSTKKASDHVDLSEMRRAIR